MAAKASELRTSKVREITAVSDTSVEMMRLNLEKMETSKFSNYVDLPALRTLLETEVALVKASYIIKLAASNQPMPRRQDIPQDAFVDQPMLDKLFQELEALCKNRFHAMLEMHFPGVVIVSYAWGAQQHPDQNAQMLREVLAPAIEWYMSERASYVLRGGFDGLGDAGNFCLKGWSEGCAHELASIDFGVFVDYMSMYQKPRTAEQDQAFKNALQQMDVLYAHQMTVKFRLTWQLSMATGLPYWARGWPWFETAVAAMISSSWHVLDLGQVDWTKPIAYYKRKWAKTDSEDTERISMRYEGAARSFEELATQGSYHYRNETVGIAALLKHGRRPPQLPDAFAAEITAKKFTNDADVEAVIKMHARVCTQVLAGVETLSYNELGWGPFEAADLAKMILACPKLKSLELYKNPWGDRGVAALASGLASGLANGNALPGALESIEFFGLDCTNVGDAGAIGIASLIRNGKLPKLNHLRFYAGAIGDAGFTALKEAMRALPHFCLVELHENPDSEGKRAFESELAIEPDYVPQPASDEGPKVVLVPHGDSSALVFEQAASLATGECAELTLSSHPAMAVVPESRHPMLASEWSFIKLRLGRQDMAMRARFDDGFVIRATDERVFDVCGWKLVEGTDLCIVKSMEAKGHTFKKTMADGVTPGGRSFVVNDNGTIALAAKPDLVLGVGR